MNKLGGWVAIVGLGFVLTVLAPRTANAQQGVLVVQLPFSGEANDALRAETENAVRSALLARGLQSPDRASVAAALGVDVPRDTTSIVSFGRSMGATHVITGELVPLTGQYNLRLRLYEVASSRVAEQYRNVGAAEVGSVIPTMVAALFVPGALQLSPEAQAQAREAAERQREEDRRRAEEEARRRQQEAERRRQEAERSRRVYRVGEGGVVSAGVAAVVGGRVTSVSSMVRRPEAAVVGARIEGSYLVVPSLGLDLGGALMLLGLPSGAFTLGPVARISWPPTGHLPLRGGAGVALGVFQGVQGARTTGLWFSLDVRAEYDIVPALTAFAGAVFDLGTDAFGALSGTVGLRFHFGDLVPSANPAPAPASLRGGATQTWTTGHQARTTRVVGYRNGPAWPSN